MRNTELSVGESISQAKQPPKGPVWGKFLKSDSASMLSEGCDAGSIAVKSGSD
jgi:hypothetical protein